MDTIDRTRLQRFLDLSGDALRDLAARMESDGASTCVVDETTSLADEADALRALVETGADLNESEVPQPGEAQPPRQ